MNAGANEPLDDIEAPTPVGESNRVEYSMSAGIVARLARLGVSIAFTSYQSGILYFSAATPGGLISVSRRAQADGICVEEGGLTLVSGAQIMRFHECS